MFERTVSEAAAADRQCPGIKLVGTFREQLGKAAVFAVEEPHKDTQAHTHAEWWFGDSVGVHMPPFPKITSR